MGVFCRVEADRAGPSALGILVPPARRTFVILRPRALPCDLLVCRSPTDLTFHALTHDEASATAQALFRGLRDGLARVEIVADSGSGRRLLVHVGPVALVACPRAAGEPYAPLAAASPEAPALAGALGAVLLPVGEQEVYFNTRFFGQPTP